MQHQDLADMVITDVCPYSLGTDVQAYKNRHSTGTKFYPIIERNTTIPVSRVERLVGTKDYQTEVLIPVYQGESYNVDENVKIGELSISIPRAKAGEEPFEVRFTYDINGLLEVEVTVVSTGVKKTALFSNQKHELTDSEIMQSLEKLQSLKVHPRDRSENRQIVAELENLYSFFRGEERDEIDDQISHFLSLLEMQDLEAIARERERAREFIEAFTRLF
jgi:molecular chaperone HscC